MAFFGRKNDFAQQKNSILMVVFQEISKHQDSNARNETKKHLLDFNSVYGKFLIENLMKNLKTLVAEKHVFDYEINPYWYQFLELLDHQQSDAKIKILCSSTEPISGVAVPYDEILEANKYVVKEKPEIEKRMASELNNFWDLPD